MPLTLKDMSNYRHAVALSGSIRSGTRALIEAIINEDNTSKIVAGGGAVSGNKQKFFNHMGTSDPSTNGVLPTNVRVWIYYQPATAHEYNHYEVVDKNVGLLSGRGRLAVREEGGRYSFWLTSHPKEKPGLRTNVYMNFTPVDPAR